MGPYRLSGEHENKAVADNRTTRVKKVFICCIPDFAPGKEKQGPRGAVLFRRKPAKLTTLKAEAQPPGIRTRQEASGV
jgi:hypothetical protein